METEGRDQGASLKGVVFNEMKGAMSSVDEVMEETAAAVLVPDNCYGFNSGGNPAVIPELTYDTFIDTYKRYYHPDNARIWLDGDIPAEETFALLEEYLNRFTASGRAVELRPQQPRPAQRVNARYAIARDEDPAEKTHILFTRLLRDWSDKAWGLAVSVLLDAVAGGNDSPFKRAILDAGLGQDLDVSLQDGVQQSAAAVWVRNTEADRLDAIRDTLRATAEKLVSEGVDRKDLEASINRLAFRLKEPTEPQGLMRAIMAQNAWLYGGDPALYLTFDAELKQLRDMLATDAYEQLLREIFLSPEDTHEIVLTPDPAMDERLREEEQARLDARLVKLDDAAYDRLVADNRRLLDWQQTPDSPEAHASLPQLTLDEAWEAAELAGIADDIRAMPMGMQTIISEGQGGISGGQKQRLMIARAVAPKPKILMFDEATSALDNKTQRQVSEALDRLKCTRIVIAHRLSTIKNCDRILVLDKGQILEDGTYDELIERNGFFAELVARQRLDNTQEGK